MSQARIDDLVDRLLSRKLALCLLMIVLALIGFWSGNLTFPELMTAAITAAGVYSATNAVETIATRPAAPTVTVEAPASPVPVTPELVAAVTAELERHRDERVAARLHDATPADHDALISKPPSWLTSEGAPIRTDYTTAKYDVPPLGTPLTWAPDVTGLAASAAPEWRHTVRTGPPVPSHPSGPSSADAIGTEPVASVPLVRGG